MSGGPVAAPRAGVTTAKRLPAPALALPNRPPPYGFFKGMGLGVVVVLPLVAAAVWMAARIGIGNQNVNIIQHIRMAALFAGVAAILTAGGVGRLAAHACLLTGGRRNAVWRAARAQAVASAGLALIAAIPHGHLPAHPAKWLWIAALGAVGGAIAGSVIGLLCGTPLKPRAPTVKDIIRAMPGDLARPRPPGAGASATSIPVQKPEPPPVVVEPPPPTPPPVAAPAPAPVVESAAKPKPRKRRKPPVSERMPTATPPPGSTRAALVTTPPPVLARMTDVPAIDTSVATSPSDDAGATPLPKPVPLGDDITGVEDEPAPRAMPLAPEPSIVGPAPDPPEPKPPSPPPPHDRIEHTDVPTDVRTDVRTDVQTDVRDPADPTEPREK